MSKILILRNDSVTCANLLWCLQRRKETLRIGLYFVIVVSVLMGSVRRILWPGAVALKPWSVAPWSRHRQTQRTGVAA
jgi:hypothetical protein